MDSSVSEEGGGADALVTPKQEVIMPEEEQPTAGPSSAAAAPSSDSPPEAEVPATSDQFPNSFQAVQRCVFCSALLTLSEKSKLLECLHAVCSGCLVSWSEGCTADATAAPAVPPKKLCPECQVTSRYDHLIENKFLLEVGVLPANGASGNDSNGGSSTSTGSGSGSADSGTDSSEIKCNNCADVLATDWCDNCRDYICEACTTAHKQLACTKDHIIRPKDDIYIRKERSCFENYPCPNHPKELLLLYCNSCETMTCRDCQLSHFHRTHNYSYVNEIADDAKAEMKRLLSDVQYKSDIIHAAIDILDERTRKIAIKKSEILTEIKEIVTKLTEIVSKSGRDLMFAVNEACSTKLEVHRTHKKTLVAISKQAAHCTDFVKKALASSSNNCLLFGKHQILAHLNRIKGQKSQVPNPEFPIAISLYTANMDTLLKVMTNFAILKVDGHTYPPKAGDTIPTPPPLPLTASSGPCGSAQQQTHQHQQLQLLLHQAQQNHQQPPPTQHHHQVAGHHQQPPPPPYQVATTNQQQQPQQQLQQQPQQQLQQQQQQQQLLGHLAASQQHQQSQQQQLQQQQSQPQQSQPQQSQPQQQQQLQQQQSQLHNLVTGPQSTANHIVQLQQSQQMQFQRHQQQMELTRQQSNQQQLAATHTQQKQQQSQSKVLHPLQHMYYGNYRAGSSGTSLAGQSQSQTGQQQQQPMRAIRQQPQVTSSTHPPPQRQSSQVIMYGKHSAQTQPQPQQLQYMGSSSSVDMNAFNTGGSGGGGGYHAVGQGEQTAPPQATVRKVAHGIPPAVRSTQQQHHQQQQHYQRAAHQQLQQINHSMMRGVHQPSQQVSQHQQLVRQLSSGPAAVTTSQTSPLSGISWHIPQPEPAETRHQQQGSSQGIILVAPAFSCGPSAVQDIAGQRLLCSNSGLGHDPASHHHPQQQQQQDSSFKIMLTKAATPPTPARTPTVTSSAPKTPSPIAQPSTSAHSAKGDDAADSLEKFCRESISVINDVMMTYTGFSTNGNSTTGGVSKRRSSSSRVGGVPAAPPTGLPTSSSMLHLASSKTENNMSESMVHSSTGQPTPGSNESHGL